MPGTPNKLGLRELIRRRKEVLQTSDIERARVLAAECEALLASDVPNPLRRKSLLMCCATCFELLQDADNSRKIAAALEANRPSEVTYLFEKLKRRGLEGYLDESKAVRSRRA
jgi:hypothetical protein